MIVIYVIKSLKDKFRYVGITNDVNRRIAQHNLGRNAGTRTHKPFKLMLTEKHSDYASARKREKFLKSGVGRKFLNNLES